MKTFFLGIFIFLTTISVSQKNDFKISYTEKNIGINLLDSSEIKGLEYIFPKRIHKIYFDAKSNLLTVQLRKLSKNGKWLKNRGHILLYDLRNKKVKWSKKIVYESNRLQQFDSTLIFTVGNTSYYIDRNTGADLWKIPNTFYHVDSKCNIGIGYKNKHSINSDELQGIDLKNGKILWTKELNRDYGWNDLFYTNDSTLIIVASGLHSINIKTGKGWDYNTVTGKKDYSGTVAANAAGVALGLLTGTFIVTTGHNVIHDILSNVLIDSSNIYFSSKEQLAKIDKKTGKVIWTHPFLKNLTGKSSIFTDDEYIYMINNGYAFMGYRKINFGEPFIAAFEKKTGKQKYFSLINNKKNPILSFKISDKIIYLISKDKIAKYSLETGNLIKEEILPNENFGEFKYIIGNQVFKKTNEQKFICLPKSDTTKIFIFTDKGKILGFNEQLNLTNILNYDDLYISYIQLKRFKFIIAKNNLTWIIDEKGEKTAELDVTPEAFLIGKILYDKQNNKFIEIDLSNIIKD